jgi:hypothetical protein
MDDVIEQIRAVRDQLALSDVFDDWLSGEVICGMGSMG